MVPTTPIETAINCSIPIATPDYYPMAADGRIHTVLGTIERYDGRTVVLSAGRRLDTDIVIQATGWKLGVPFLPEDY
ncbi:hypothetical protein, partial [Klebsiella michiganensis]|uniref:hypothetical protein n=1 Tax=Klebsiella michiganensis TaxID=1134687 RepID=UPI001952DED1